MSSSLPVLSYFSGILKKGSRWAAERSVLLPLASLSSRCTSSQDCACRSSYLSNLSLSVRREVISVRQLCSFWVTCDHCIQRAWWFCRSEENSFSILALLSNKEEISVLRVVISFLSFWNWQFWESRVTMASSFSRSTRSRYLLFSLRLLIICSKASISLSLMAKLASRALSDSSLYLNCAAFPLASSSSFSNSLILFSKACLSCSALLLLPSSHSTFPFNCRTVAQRLSLEFSSEEASSDDFPLSFNSLFQLSIRFSYPSTLLTSPQSFLLAVSSSLTFVLDTLRLCSRVASWVSLFLQVVIQDSRISILLLVVVDWECEDFRVWSSVVRRCWSCFSNKISVVLLLWSLASCAFKAFRVQASVRKAELDSFSCATSRSPTEATVELGTVTLFVDEWASSALSRAISASILSISLKSVVLSTFLAQFSFSKEAMQPLSRSFSFLMASIQQLQR